MRGASAVLAVVCGLGLSTASSAALASELAHYCAPDESGQFPAGEKLEKGETEQYVWGKGEACIQRPVAEVWAVLRNQELMKWEHVDSVKWVRKLDLPPEVSFLFETTYKVKNIIPVDWTMAWEHRLLTGDQAAPGKVQVNYRKIRGTHFIRYWQGAITLEAVAPGVTAFMMENQVDATRTDQDDAQSAVMDVIEKLRMGEPAGDE